MSTDNNGGGEPSAGANTTGGGAGDTGGTNEYIKLKVVGQVRHFLVILS